jgi:patatin-like phospholipase/acyl hydrolase
MTVRVLSVDGGGIRGLIPALVLAELEQRAGRAVSALFDVLAGTSKGGILALALSRPGEHGRPAWRAQDLVELYEVWGPKIFSRTIWQRIRSAEGALDEKYRAADFDEMLERYFGETRLAEALNDVLITAYDTERRVPFIFKSAKARERADDDFPMRLAARATASAPTYFEPLRLETGTVGQYYSLIDGGVFANNPAMCAYAEVRRRRPDDDVLLVSLGTGILTRPLHHHTIKDWGALEWARPILDVVFDGVNQCTDYQLRQLLPAAAYHRFQVRLDERSEHIDDAGPENLRALRLKGEELIATHGARLDALCERLLACGDSGTGPEGVARGRAPR